MNLAAGNCWPKLLTRDKFIQLTTTVMVGANHLMFGADTSQATFTHSFVLAS